MIKSSLDAADMFLTRHMMRGIVLPRNPLDKHSHPASPVMLLFAVIRIHPSSCKSSTIVMRAGFSSQNRNDLMWRVMDERRILYFICSGLMSAWLWCRVSPAIQVSQGIVFMRCSSHQWYLLSSSPGYFWSEPGDGEDHNDDLSDISAYTNSF